LFIAKNIASRMPQRRLCSRSAKTQCSVRRKFQSVDPCVAMTADRT
jgi:hypothetical protein